MRPSFKELTNHWEKMLEDSVEYLDLNPRTVHNQAYFASLHALDSPSSAYFLSRPFPPFKTRCSTAILIRDISTILVQFTFLHANP